MQYILSKPEMEEFETLAEYARLAQHNLNHLQDEFRNMCARWPKKDQIGLPLATCDGCPLRYTVSMLPGYKNNCIANLSKSDIKDLP